MYNIYNYNFDLDYYELPENEKKDDFLMFKYNTIYKDSNFIPTFLEMENYAEKHTVAYFHRYWIYSSNILLFRTTDDILKNFNDLIVLSELIEFLHYKKDKDYLNQIITKLKYIILNNEYDGFIYCLNNAKINKQNKKNKNTEYTIDYLYSAKRIEHDFIQINNAGINALLLPSLMYISFIFRLANILDKDNKYIKIIKNLNIEIVNKYKIKMPEYYFSEEELKKYPYLLKDKIISTMDGYYIIAQNYYHIQENDYVCAFKILNKEVLEPVEEKKNLYKLFKSNGKELQLKKDYDNEHKKQYVIMQDKIIRN